MTYIVNELTVHESLMADRSNAGVRIILYFSTPNEEINESSLRSKTSSFISL